MDVRPLGVLFTFWHGEHNGNTDVNGVWQPGDCLNKYQIAGAWSVIRGIGTFDHMCDDPFASNSNDADKDT